MGEVYEVGVEVGELRVGVPFVVWWGSGPEFSGGWRTVVGEKPVSCLMIELGNRNEVANMERVARNGASRAVVGKPVGNEGAVEEVRLVADAGDCIEEGV